MYTKILAACLVLLATGCAPVGNLLFAPHPGSLAEVKPKLELSQEAAATCVPDSEEALLAFGVGELAGLAISGLEKVLRHEATKYRATYSATQSGDVATLDCLKLKDGDREVLELALGLEPTGTRVVHGAFDPTAVKAKVVSWPVRTWAKGTNPFSGPSWHHKLGNAIGLVNPLMILHFLYGLFDDDVYKVQYAAKVRFDTIDPAKRSAVPSEITIGLGKYEIEEIVAEGKLKDAIATGFVPRPAGTPLLSNVTATVIEANELGDLIGKGADLIGDKKSDLSGRLKGLVGLE